MTDALRRQQHDCLGELLDKVEAESGTIPDDVMEEARQLGRGPAGRTKARPAKRLILDGGRPGKRSGDSATV